MSIGSHVVEMGIGRLEGILYVRSTTKRSMFNDSLIGLLRTIRLFLVI
jgi:hypothetical protein